MHRVIIIPLPSHLIRILERLKKEIHIIPNLAQENPKAK
jgi:hypothetical protein